MTSDAQGAASPEPPEVPRSAEPAVSSESLATPDPAPSPELVEPTMAPSSSSRPGAYEGHPGASIGLVDPQFPRQDAATRSFSCGVPRQFCVSPDGSRVVFCRSVDGTDPALALWVADLDRAEERLIATPDELGILDAAPTAERSLRAWQRERSTGITNYATDAAVRHAVFAYSGKLWYAELAVHTEDTEDTEYTESSTNAPETGTTEPADTVETANMVEATGPEKRTDVAVDSDETEKITKERVPGVVELLAHGPVVDPRLSPDGRFVAYVAAGALRLLDRDTAADHVLAAPESAEVAYGLAEYVAGEDMGRTRGHWWSPDGEQIAVARVDESAVQRWHIADPTHPEREPQVLRYPTAGSPNATVELRVVNRDGNQTRVDWGWDEAEYLAAVDWSRHGLYAVLQNRAQTVVRLVMIDPDSGLTTLVREERDPAWVPIVAGVPTCTESGSLVWVSETPWPPREPERPGVNGDADEPIEGTAATTTGRHLDGFDPEDTRRLVVDGKAVTPAGLQVRQVCDVDGDVVLFTAADEPTDTQLWQWSHAAGLSRLSSAPGVHDGRAGGGTTVVISQVLREHGVRVTVSRPGGEPVTIPSYAETPQITPAVELIRAGDHQLRVAVLFPTGHVHGSRRLPVLLDPHGGPNVQRVLATRAAYLKAQWYADQGFCVIVADGRGTPGRGPAWDRSIHLGADAELNIEDQIVALHAAAERFGDLDLNRVAIWGSSHGGWLAALAVLRRPDVFHAAVATAPITDPRLCSPHYTERFFGHPDEHPTAYDESTLLSHAAALRRPLMLVHGLLDDDVVVAHTLRLSAALTEAGRPHTLLPLAGMTHMPTDPDTTAHLAALQVGFLQQALAGPAADGPAEFG